MAGSVLKMLLPGQIRKSSGWKRQGGGLQKKVGVELSATLGTVLALV